MHPYLRKRFGIIKQPAASIGSSVPTVTGGNNVPSNAPSVPRPQPTTVQAAPNGNGALIDSLIDDDIRVGSDNASVVVVEFSDFQCPFCRKWWRESFFSLQNEYIKTGKVQFVYRDFPLNFHPAAIKMAEGAECARDQAKWEQMHDKIFIEQDKQGQGTIQFTGDGSNEIKKWASEISGMDATKFNSCLDSGKYTQEVQKDFADGTQVGVSGTPSFYIGKRGGQAQNIVGAQPYSALKQTIDQLLK